MHEDDEAIAKLDALTKGDPEAAHSEADEILLSLVSPSVADAWRNANDRIGFWYA